MMNIRIGIREVPPNEKGTCDYEWFLFEIEKGISTLNIFLQTGSVTDRWGAALLVVRQEADDVWPGGGPRVAAGLAAQAEGGRAGAVGQQHAGDVQLGGCWGGQNGQPDQPRPGDSHAEKSRRERHIWTQLWNPSCSTLLTFWKPLEDNKTRSRTRF